MKKSTKILLITASAFVLAGLMVFAVAMSMVNWDFDRLNNLKYETNTYVIKEKFDHIHIESKTDDIIFRLSDDGTCKVVCYEQEKMKHLAEVNEKTLEISVNDTREWYEHIGLFSFDSAQTTVYLPKKSYNSLSINTSTGDIEMPGDFIFNSISITGSTGDVNCNASSNELTKIDLSTGNMTINGASSGKMQLCATTGDIRVESILCKGDLSVDVSTGKVLLSDVKCNSFNSGGSTGDIDLKNLIASQTFSLERSTGDIILDGCNAEELFIKTDTGDVTGTLLSDKVFITDTSTGNISVPKTITGGKCEITTSTGDIRISIKE